MRNLASKPASDLAIRRINKTYARTLWNATVDSIQVLNELTSNYRLSIRLGELILLKTTWYITHAGLLKLATRRHCEGIHVEPVKEFCDPAANRWVFEAIVYKRQGRAFYGYGDADPGNVSSLVHGAEMRVAETRAVNRALRKAYGVGLCSVEEIGSGSGIDFSPVPPAKHFAPSHDKVVPINGHGKVLLRDQFNELVRQHALDAELVKRYAAAFCGTEKLRDASRELVEDFIRALKDQLSNDPSSLLERLQSYAPSTEATEVSQ